MKRGFYLLAVTLFVLSGCGQNQSSENQSDIYSNTVSVTNSVTESSPLSQVKSTKDNTSLESDVVLMVGDKKFTVTDFKNWLYFFYTFQGYNLTEKDVERMWSRLPAENKPAVFEAFVREIILSSIAVERGINRDPVVASKIEMAKASVLGEELLNRESGATKLSIDDVKRMYEEAVEALDRDIKAGTNTFAETEFAKRLGSLITGMQAYMLNKEYVLYKIEVNSGAEADKVMAEYYSQKGSLSGQKNANVEAFRSVARSRMGVNYRDRISTYDIMEKMQRAKEKNDKTGIKYWQDYYQLLVTAEGSSDPVKGQVGDKWLVVLLPKSPEVSVVHWEDLPSEARTNIQTMLMGLQQQEKVNSLISDFRKRTVVKDDIIKPEHIVF